jgi:hypothetical protein
MRIAQQAVGMFRHLYRKWQNQPAKVNVKVTEGTSHQAKSSVKVEANKVAAAKPSLTSLVKPEQDLNIARSAWKQGVSPEGIIQSLVKQKVGQGHSPKDAEQYAQLITRRVGYEVENSQQNNAQDQSLSQSNGYQKDQEISMMP